MEMGLDSVYGLRPTAWKNAPDARFKGRVRPSPTPSGKLY